MQIAWTEFTPLSALMGGLLIGVASGLFMLGRGRIAGISSIVGGPLKLLLQRQSLADEAPRLLFIGGLLMAPWLWQLLAPLPAARGVAGPLGLIAAGLLVGAGTRMGMGCTSGHGVCGLSRGSLRSLVNVLMFMAVGMVTVALLRWAA
jgi:uncharacterized protein